MKLNLLSFWYRYFSAVANESAKRGRTLRNWSRIRSLGSNALSTFSRIIENPLRFPRRCPSAFASSSSWRSLLRSETRIMHAPHLQGDTSRTLPGLLLSLHYDIMRAWVLHRTLPRDISRGYVEQKFAIFYQKILLDILKGMKTEENC